MYRVGTDYGYQPFLRSRYSKGNITLEDASLWNRARTILWEPLRTWWYSIDTMRHQRERQRNAGVEPYAGIIERYRNAMLLIATAPGFEVSVTD